MQRKPGFPVANCNIKMPDSIPPADTAPVEDDSEHQRRRQQLINFAHSQWGFNNWSWAVNKQDLDFVDFSNGKYAAGVVSFVTITVKSFDIHRENIGYATSTAHMKGLAIYQARKSAVTNALRETLLSFGGSVATELIELLGNNKTDEQPHIPEQTIENNQNIINKMPLSEPKNIQKSPEAARRPVKNSVPVSKPATLLPPANKPPPLAPNQPPPPPPAGNQPRPQRPNSNEPAAENAAEEEARAERKRRQRQAQEEFRLKQMMKQKDDKQDFHKSSFENLLLALPPTQDIIIEQTGESNKRKSPEPGSAQKKRPCVYNKLDIVQNK